MNRLILAGSYQHWKQRALFPTATVPRPFSAWLASDPACGYAIESGTLRTARVPDMYRGAIYSLIDPGTAEKPVLGNTSAGREWDFTSGSMTSPQRSLGITDAPTVATYSFLTATTGGATVLLLVWVDPAVASSDVAFFASGLGTGTSRGVRIGKQSSGSGTDLQLLMSDGAISQLTLNTGTPMVAGWNIVGFRKNNLDYETILNGAVDQSGTAGGGSSGAPNRFVIGSSNSAGDQSNSKVRACAVWDVRLSDAEMLAAIRHLCSVCLTTETFGTPTFYFDAEKEGHSYGAPAGIPYFFRGLNSGSIGGSFTAAPVSGLDPYVSHFSNGKQVPTFQAGACWGGVGTASDAKAFHDGTNQTITFRFEFNWTVTYNFLLSTMEGLAGDTGCHVKIGPSYELTIDVGNGSTITSMSSATGLFVDGGVYTLQITKTAAGAWTAYLDGVSVASGTVASPCVRIVVAPADSASGGVEAAG